ncbi:cytochrome P450 CYP749A22 isoform X2 [Jatropha curcas]|uniref:cytochrome P450 CYP749A22 isoform X2 n=1 Tax=Jatropha curcas TaxID=180498 RepID=UPI0009D72ACE|nr:cytochrome P450 CYP749A22 isoform X2 [Jatropha curcas]
MSLNCYSSLIAFVGIAVKCLSVPRTQRSSVGDVLHSLALALQWLVPICIQSIMRSQGIKGPSYRFLHGNTKQIAKMRKEAIYNPMELSHHILPRIQPHIYSWMKLYGMNFLLWYGARAQLTVTEPELVKEILNNKEETYCKIGFQDYIKMVLGDGLVLSTGEKWLKMRKLANYAFHGENLKGMVPAMLASVEMMVERWRHHDGKEIEVFQEFKVLTSEIISRTAFGSSYLEGEEVFDMLKKMIFIVARNHYKVRIPCPGIKFLKTGDELELDKIQKEIRDTIINMIKKREKATMMGELDGYGSDFLGLLIKAYNDPDKNKRISIDDMIDECKTFYVAGQETTASSLTWTVLLLAIHTDWQDEARKEVLELFGQQNPTADGVARLKTMNIIINESLRLYPPVFHVTREVQREVRLGQLNIPNKIETYIPTLALHTDYKIWGEDAYLFKPERFAGGVAKATNNSVSSFLPFGLGPRTCVGLNFAITEKKIALSMILQRYKFTLSPSYVHSPVQILTMCPQHGVQEFTFMNVEYQTMCWCTGICRNLHL